MEKEIEYLEKKKKELELFLSVSRQQEPNHSKENNLPEHSHEVARLRSFFSHAGIMEESFQLELFPPKVGKNNSMTQEFKASFAFKDFPSYRIGAHISAQDGDKKNPFHFFEAIRFSPIPDEEGNHSPKFSFLNAELSKLESPMYLRLLRGFLEILSDWESILAGLEESLSPNLYYLEEFEKEEDRIWTMELTLGLKSSPLVFVQCYISLRSGFSIESNYSVAFTQRGEAKAREFSFPEELILGGRYGSWSVRQCIGELAKLTSFDGENQSAMISDSTPTSRTRRPLKRKLKRLS